MKTLSQILGVAHIKSAQSIGLRSIPKVQRSDYLELYMLRNEKNRLEGEICVLDKRRNSVKKQLDTISARIEKLQKEIDQQEKAKSYENQPTPAFKKVAVGY